MSYNSGDEQSEDGELRQSPEIHRQQKEGPEYSLSDDDGENVDSLDIKPPQARLSNSQGSRKRRSDGHERHHKRERHRDERHSHRDKHHRDKRSNKEREHYQREKERYYREQQMYENQQYYRERSNKESRHKYDEKKVRESRRGESSAEKHRRYEEEKRELADKKLQDLRERLLSKRGGNKNEDELKEGKERKYKDNENVDSALQGEAGAYVKEIINISTEERRHKLTEEERTEQELRREKLLQAEREMDRLKEQSRMERERRHLEKVSKRRHEENEEFYSKKAKIEETITVTDNSEEEENEERYNDDDDDDEEEEEEGDTARSSTSRQSERSSESREGSSERKSQSSSPSDRSRTSSPINNKEKTESEDEKEPDDDNDDDGDDDDDDDDEKEKEKEQETDKNDEQDNLPPYYPAVQGCRSVEEFQCLNRIEEGTYGVVYRAKDKRTEDIVALKRLKMEKEKEGFPITSLREINTLLKGQHPNIVTVREIVVGSNMDKIFIVMDYVEHDLKSLMETMRHKKQNFMPGEIKCLLRQLLSAVAHLHDNWILHRDLKTSNLLLSHKGILKVGDFGLAREYGSPLKAYTPVVVTLWYRAPELLLCTKEYSTPIDMWSVGCIFAELILMNALFPGKSEVDQLNRIFKDLGTPSEKIWPGFNKLPAVQRMKFTDYPISNLRAKFHSLSELGLNLLIKFLTFDPAQRVTAEEAIQHTYFNEPPLPIDPAMFPTWPAKSELGHKRALAASPKPPSGGGEYKKLGGDGDDDGYGFRIGMGVDARRMGAGFSLKF